jgi:RuvB-like protein 1
MTSENRKIETKEDIVSPHGIPLDLLDRLLIIRTLPYAVAEIEEIIKLRAQTEGLQVDDEGTSALSEIGSSTTLRYENIYLIIFIKMNFISFFFRYAIQLLTPAFQSCKVNGRTQIIKEDILEVNGLFLDAKRSATFLTDNSKYMK